MNVNHKLLKYFLIICFFSVSVFAQEKSEKVKIFIYTDFEGIGGVVTWKYHCMKNSMFYEECRHLLVSEINAAVEGAFDGGATEVVVWDGHSDGSNIPFGDLNPKAFLISGMSSLQKNKCIDSSFDAVFFVGQHSMANTPEGNLAHSYSEVVDGIWINDLEVGETGIRTLISGYYGAPVIFFSGDEQACEEMRRLIPDAVTVATKKGLSMYSALSYPSDRVRAEIRSKACEAVKKMNHIKPFWMTGPYTFKIRYKDLSRVERVLKNPGWQSIDEYTVKKQTADFWDGLVGSGISY